LGHGTVPSNTSAYLHDSLERADVGQFVCYACGPELAVPHWSRIALSGVPVTDTTGNRRIAEAFGPDGRRGASASSAPRGAARRALRKLLTTLCSASAWPRRLALAAEQVLKRMEVPAHGIDVA
jgi:hypothetical protein